MVSFERMALPQTWQCLCCGIWTVTIVGGYNILVKILSADGIFIRYRDMDDVALQEYNKKVVLIGDPGVGKTSLIRRFVENSFSDKYIHTIGTKITKRVIEFPDMDSKVVLLVWDIVGQKSLALLDSYFRGAAGVLAVCDITRDETLQSLDDWVANVRKIAGEVPIVLLPNKIDLQETAMVDNQSCSIAARKFKAPYYMTSAKTGANVELAFHAIGRMVLGEPPLTG
jgi:small GTP-binding protein